VLECIIGSRKVRSPLAFVDPTSDGYEYGGSSASASVYDIAMAFLGIPDTAEEIMRFAVAREFSLPANCASSLCVSRVAAAAETTFSLRDSGVEFGTITFALGATTSTIVSTAHDFAIGDTFEMVCVAADATLEDISATFVGVV
jgi:hypothetical protein